MVYLDATLVVAALVLAVPTLVVTVECFFALLPRRKADSNSTVQSGAPKVVVLIPAHNEEQSIRHVIEAIRPELVGDRNLKNVL